MNFRLALADHDGNVIGALSPDGSLHIHNAVTRVLEKDEFLADGRVLGRKGDTVRLVSPLEAADAKPEAFDELGVVLVDELGAVKATLGTLKGFRPAGEAEQAAKETKRKDEADAARRKAEGDAGRR